MALRPRYLADKSALARTGNPAVGAVIEPLLLEGAVATCGVVELEILYSAVDADELTRTRRRRAAAFTVLPIRQDHVERAMDVMLLLARRGHHRAAGIPDLLIAAIAEDAGLTILHYDRDFDHIAAATGQPTMWVVPRGSVP